MALESRGYFMSDSWYQTHSRQRGAQQQLEKECLATDFEDQEATKPNPLFQRWVATPGGSRLPVDIFPLGCSMVLQCVETMDVAQSMPDRAAMHYNEQEGLGGGSSMRKRLLKLLLTDGHVRIPAMEFRSCPVLDNLLPGGKIRIKLSPSSPSDNNGVLKPDHRRNMLLLAPDRVELCGGVIPRLQAQQDAAMQHLRTVLSGKPTRVQVNNADAAPAPMAPLHQAAAAPPQQQQHLQQVGAPPPPPMQQAQRGNPPPPPPPPPPQAPPQQQTVMPQQPQGQVQQEQQQQPRSLHELIGAVNSRQLAPGAECQLYGTLVGAENLYTEQVQQSADGSPVLAFVFPVWIDDGQGTILRVLMHPKLVVQCLGGVEASEFNHWIDTSQQERLDESQGALEENVAYLPGVMMRLRWIGYNQQQGQQGMPNQQQQQEPLFHLMAWSSALGTMSFD